MSRPNPLQRGVVPLHHQLYLELRRHLDEGTWKVGERLPTERELGERYACSLITVRRALDELRRERRLERIPGRGTFVTAPPIERDLGALTSFTEEMRERGLEPETKLISAGAGPAEPAVADALGLERGAPTLHVERLRCAGGKPLLLEKAYLPAASFPGLLEADLERSALYEVLAGRFGLRPVRAREVLEPILPSAREAALLEQSPRKPALLIELVAFAADDQPVEYCRAVVRGDRARYGVDASGPGINALGLTGALEHTSRRESMR